MNTDNPEKTLLEDPYAPLERAFIVEYLHNQGYTLEDLQRLPEEVAKRLMKEASLYASTKLAEVVNRARFVDEIHGSAPPLS